MKAILIFALLLNSFHANATGSSKALFVFWDTIGCDDPITDQRTLVLSEGAINQVKDWAKNIEKYPSESLLKALGVKISSEAVALGLRFVELNIDSKKAKFIFSKLDSQGLPKVTFREADILLAIQGNIESDHLGYAQIPGRERLCE